MVLWKYTAGLINWKIAAKSNVTSLDSSILVGIFSKFNIMANITFAM